MKASIYVIIKRKPQLSPTVFELLFRYVEFKADFHHVYILALKDLDQKWYDIPYLVTDGAIVEVLKCWPAYWNTPSNLATGTSKSTEKHKKEATQLKVQ